MTNEEAISSIDDVLSSDYHYDESSNYQLTSDDFEWLEKSKEALEKQIPKKPIKSDREIRYCEVWKCPNCGFEWSGRVVDYCYKCGQAIDWRDAE